MNTIDLNTVRRPARYIGNELNVVKKDLAKIKLRSVLCFPDVYEVGMSNLGIRILYEVINAQEEQICDLVFNPWTDMQEALRSNNMKLSSLEYKIPIKDFDLLGFSLAYELNYTNILDILDLSGIPILACDRNLDFPLIIAGGACCANPEPIADFFDLLVIGEAEEVIIEITETLKKFKDKNSINSSKLDKESLLLELAHIEGVYVPSFYNVEYSDDGRMLSFLPKFKDFPSKIIKRIIKDLDNSVYPVNWLVPNIEIVHDRITLEVMRGCPNSCRFCQARNFYWPFRLRKSENIENLAKNIYKKTGYEEISLCGLSVSDYPDIGGLTERLSSHFKEKGVGISLSSLRADSSLNKIPSFLALTRKTTLTFAPEAGSERLRKLLNKNINMDAFFEVARNANEVGYRHIKLYFMIGIPSEEVDDLLAIVDLVKEIACINKERPLGLNLSISNFIPKPHTPFQWYGMCNLKLIEEKKSFLKGKLRESGFFRSKRNKLSFHNETLSFLEAVFSRGDRRLSNVIVSAWKKGARFDSWDEKFSFQIWLDAFRENSIDPEFYAYRHFSKDEILHWEHISLAPSKEYLYSELDRIKESMK